MASILPLLAGCSPPHRGEWGAPSREAAKWGNDVPAVGIDAWELTRQLEKRSAVSSNDLFFPSFRTRQFLSCICGVFTKRRKHVGNLLTFLANARKQNIYMIQLPSILLGSKGVTNQPREAKIASRKNHSILQP